MITLESNQRLSQSLLWQSQRQYYAEKGLAAWKTEVPSFVTSNPFIAKQYAETFYRYILDYLTLHPEARSEPFYLLELGTGHGKFSFYFFRAFNDLVADQFDWCYIMSDFARASVNAWASDENFKNSHIDFAMIDLVADEPIMLERRGLDLNELANPLLIVANYIFDSIPHDVFYFKEGLAAEALVSLTTAEENVVNQQINDWEQVDISYQYQPIGVEYYADPYLNQILERYRNTLRHSSILFPIASFQALSRLIKLAPAGVFVLASDNGNTCLNDLQDLADPLVSFHGSLSMMVNFDAMGEFFRLHDGGAIFQGNHVGLKTCAFYLGERVLPQTTTWLDFCFQHIAPSDFYNLHGEMVAHKKTASLKALLSYLALSNWDPYGFSLVCERLRALVTSADYETKAQILAVLPKIVDQYYFMPGSLDSLFDIAVVYHSLNHYAEAAALYQRSQAYFGEHFNVLFNRGICAFYLDQFEAAKGYFTQANLLVPNDTRIQDWLMRIANQNT